MDNVKFSRAITNLRKKQYIETHANYVQVDNLIPHTRYQDNNEKNLTNAILAFCKYAQKCLAFRVSSEGRIRTGLYIPSTLPRGISDIYIEIKRTDGTGSQAIWVELKSKSNAYAKLSDDQEKYRDKVIANGGYFFHCNSLASFFENIKQIPTIKVFDL